MAIKKNDEYKMLAKQIKQAQEQGKSEEEIKPLLDRKKVLFALLMREHNQREREEEEQKEIQAEEERQKEKERKKRMRKKCYSCLTPGPQVEISLAAEIPTEPVLVCESLQCAVIASEKLIKNEGRH